MNRLVAASGLENLGARSHYAKSRGEAARIFRKAVHHSRFVRFLRFAIPVSIVLMLALIVVFAYFKPFRVIANLPLDPGRLVVSGTTIMMEQPRLTGFTQDARPYELTARVASQDLTRPSVLELTDLHARVHAQDKSVIDISALKGVYDTKADVLRLADNILLSMSSGYEARLSEAVIDMKKGTVVSDRPVAVKLLNGTINANRLEVADSGAMVLFDRGVETVLIMGPDRPGAQKASKP